MRRVSALLAAVLLVPTLAAAKPFTPSALFVFGDSLSDNGNGYSINNYPISPPNAESWSNGPTAVDYLAARLGLPLTPSTQGGTELRPRRCRHGARAGCLRRDEQLQHGVPARPGAGPALAGPGVLGLREHGHRTARSRSSWWTTRPYDPATALFFLWGGPNDLLIASTLGNPAVLPGTVAECVGNIAGHILALYTDGARNFLVPNMPDLSLDAQRAADVARRAGRALRPVLGLQGRARARAGLAARASRASTSCASTRSASISRCSRTRWRMASRTSPTRASPRWRTVREIPSTYLSWDGFHPTTAAHARARRRIRQGRRPRAGNAAAARRRPCRGGAPSAPRRLIIPSSTAARARRARCGRSGRSTRYNAPMTDVPCATCGIERDGEAMSTHPLWSRRRFLGTAVAGTGVAVWTRGLGAAAQRPEFGAVRPHRGSGRAQGRRVRLHRGLRRAPARPRQARRGLRADRGRARRASPSRYRSATASSPAP